MEDTRFESSRKRPRPVVSCHRCRQKKLKCDRFLPCQNCKKGNATDCKYNQDVSQPHSNSSSTFGVRATEQIDTENTASPTKQSTGGIGVVEELQIRVSKLEKLLQVSSKHIDLDTQRTQPQLEARFEVGNPSENNSYYTTQSTDLYTLVVKGSRSRYHGADERITLLNQFPETKDFINKTAKNDSTMASLAKEVQSLQARLQESLILRKQNRSHDSAEILGKLREFLPEKSICDTLVKIYIECFEKTSRILHVPSFVSQYDNFWTSPNDTVYNSSAFLPQLTIILAICCQFDNTSGLNDDQKTYLDMASLELVESWIDSLERKQGIDLSTLQTETLLLLARQLRYSPADKLWCAAGALVRSAMVMGLHLDPTKFARISPFHAELRRRLWVTIVHMDLQASISASMPSTVSDDTLLASGLALTNINDSEFDETTSKLPPSRPLSEFTDSLYQAFLATSLPQQIKVMKLIKTSTTHMDLGEIAKEGRSLMDVIRQIPYPLRVDGAFQNNQSHLFDRVLLEVYLRRPLLCLCRSALRQNLQNDSNFHEIQQICLGSSILILSHQDNFDPMVADLSIPNTKLYWDLFQIYCRNDILTAAMSICKYLTSSTCQLEINPPNVDNSVAIGLINESGKTQFTKAKLTRILENTLDSLIRRIADSSIVLKDIIFLSVAIQSTRSVGSPEFKENLMNEGVKKVLLACRETLLQTLGERKMQPSSSYIGKLQEGHEDTSNMESGSLDRTQDVSQLDYLQHLGSSGIDINQFREDAFDFSDPNIFNVEYDWGYDNLWQ